MGTELRWMVAPIQTRRSDPLGIRDVCKKPGKSMDPLPRKMHICIHVHTHYLGDSFGRFLGPLESMNSLGVLSWFALWEEGSQGSRYHQSFAQDLTA